MPSYGKDFLAMQSLAQVHPAVVQFRCADLLRPIF